MNDAHDDDLENAPAKPWLLIAAGVIFALGAAWVTVIAMGFWTALHKPAPQPPPAPARMQKTPAPAPTIQAEPTKPGAAPAKATTKQG